MRVRFSDPVGGGHKVSQYVVTEVKFLGTLVLGTTAAGQTVLARVVPEGWRVITVDIYRKCEILPFDEADPLDLLV